MPGHPIILFDGVCNFCNGAVNFVIKRDKKSAIKFGALQSEAGQQLLKQHNIPITNFESFIFIEERKVYSKSTAALRVCKYLGAGWPLMYGFIIVPVFIRNWIYDFIAKNRYKWFGKMDSCVIPDAGIKQRFL
ncbi:MAG: thiol-disulfide oxidoreductase DCC family protein [Ferruginibacter sp.]